MKIRAKIAKNKQTLHSTNKSVIIQAKEAEVSSNTLRTFHDINPQGDFHMNDSERRRYECFLRIRQFGADNSADFAAIPIAVTNFGVITTEIDFLDEHGADQQGGFADARGASEVKGTAREDLREEMSDIARTARSMEYQYDGISERFKMPRNSTDQTLLATGRAFHSEATPISADFIAYGLPAAFLTELKDAADAFEATFGVQGSAIDSHVEATAEIGEAIRRGMVARRILDGIVRNVYKTDPGKLAAWTSASHVEKPPKKKEPTP